MARDFIQDYVSCKIINKINNGLYGNLSRTFLVRAGMVRPSSLLAGASTKTEQKFLAGEFLRSCENCHKVRSGHKQALCGEIRLTGKIDAQFS